MILHTDLLTHGDLHDACKTAHVSFVDGAEERRSRTRRRRFKFRLEGYTSHRYANSGRFGAANWEGNCATWDEWGIFLNVLFQRDPEAHTGTRGYLGLEGFQHCTGGRFDTLTHTDQHPTHLFKWDETNHQSTCKCGAIRRYDNPAGLLVVKHGLVRTTDVRSVERWLARPTSIPA